MTEQADGQMTFFDLASSSGKMSPARSVPTRGETSKPSSRSSSASQTRRPPMCLCLATESGLTPDASTTFWVDSPLLGGFTTHSFGESPREENGSLLSSILVDSPPRKYFLSAKACEGILRRARARGKALPPELESALKRQSHSKNEPDALGGQRNPHPARTHRGLVNRQQSASTVSTIRGGVMSVTEGQTGTLRAQTHGHAPIVLEGNGSRPSHHGNGWNDSGVVPTLNRVERHAVMVVEPRSQDGVPRVHDGVVPTLNTAGGGQRLPCVLHRNGTGGHRDAHHRGTRPNAQHAECEDSDL